MCSLAVTIKIHSRKKQRMTAAAAGAAATVAALQQKIDAIKDRLLGRL
jgi:hypothetical protein